ncbi:cytochrome C [Geobacter pelophilus]|jgi:predicted CXXCH cytochrome family protein|uniref:Cytochrome C n=1 Tax=Geoanaerobacter pelophilus TaxID=60036 RepID=A0AAW4LBF0_9BACT|nr:cytochrome c3 family protein [Geoanaerobacter pelophilus]MBT0665182.1 cytochrome C [Geoanaerobacter pelophilus]
MKKHIIVLAAAALAAGATAAYGLGSIVGTAHDLSGAGVNSSRYSLGADEICIYCHTPHNPVQAIPLWNRNNPSGAGFTLYKTSPTLTAATQASAFADSSVSLFCMSCHDGVTKLGNIKNSMGHTMTTNNVAISPDRGDQLGVNLSASHPVGFDYDTAQSTDATLHPRAAAAVSLGTVSGGSYPFFNSGLTGGTSGTMMECASCHKVHDDEFGKFLRRDNKNSALCLACHKK